MAIVYTDGACEPNPGPGAWAAIIWVNGKVIEIGDYDDSTTNNRMEMVAAIRALSRLEKYDKKILLFSDSLYLVEGFNSWMHKWHKKGWRKGKKQVMNADLWKQLFEIKHSQLAPIIMDHVRGHSQIPGNERADKLAEIVLSNKAAHFCQFAEIGYDVNPAQLQPVPRQRIVVPDRLRLAI